MKKYEDVFENIKNREPHSELEKVYLQAYEYFEETLDKTENLLQCLHAIQTNLNLIMEKVEQQPEEREKELLLCHDLINTMSSYAIYVMEFGTQQTLNSLHCINNINERVSPHH